tara:strand:+ start:207 stop:530 length:324 start_codon:yes stop_codon:yes gene_type:complete
MENVANKKNMPDGVETIEDLVRHSLDQDYNKANKVFGDLMSDKLNTVLDQAKMKIAGQIYNGDPEDEEEIEDEEDIENEEEVEGEEEIETEDEAEEEEEEEVPVAAV